MNDENAQLPEGGPLDGRVRRLLNEDKKGTAMGWSIGEYEGRDIGYGVPAVCDAPGCDEDIDRGMGYGCGEVAGGDVGCGLFFCGKHRHRWRRGYAVCTRCADRRAPYEPKPDTAEWVQHKMTDESWSRWRAENPEWVAKHKPANV